jgi:deazaflavin-dependent oxidoreductase (nitroreductase family)
MVDSARAFNASVIEEFRANSGRVGGEWEGYTIILIHHIGAKSGTEYVTPLGCFPMGVGRFVVVASNGGSPFHPDWYRNLKANPRITVEVGAETFTVLAEELDGAARAELWPRLAAESPVGEYQARIARRIPVFLLTRLTSDFMPNEPR